MVQPCKRNTNALVKQIQVQLLGNLQFTCP
jgi:hypothetical protein